MSYCAIKDETIPYLTIHFFGLIVSITQTKIRTIKSIGYKDCRLIQRGDGYSYNYKEQEFDDNRRT